MTIIRTGKDPFIINIDCLEHKTIWHCFHLYKVTLSLFLGINLEMGNFTIIKGSWRSKEPMFHCIVISVIYERTTCQVANSLLYQVVIYYLRRSCHFSFCSPIGNCISVFWNGTFYYNCGIVNTKHKQILMLLNSHVFVVSKNALLDFFERLGLSEFSYSFPRKLWLLH